MKVLDAGHVELVDHMGSDLTVVNSARVSFAGESSFDTSEGAKLLSLKEKDIMVLYGGSVNLKNAKDILSAPHVDGVLIGGASLKVKEFTSICNLKI